MGTTVYLDISRREGSWNVDIFLFTKYSGSQGEDCFLRFFLEMNLNKKSCRAGSHREHLTEPLLFKNINHWVSVSGESPQRDEVGALEIIDN